MGLFCFTYWPSGATQLERSALNEHAFTTCFFQIPRLSSQAKKLREKLPLQRDGWMRQDRGFPAPAGPADWALHHPHWLSNGRVLLWLLINSALVELQFLVN